MIRSAGLLFCCACLSVASGARLWGQASPTATGAGSYVAVGATYSNYEFPYGKQHSGGYTIFGDAHLTRAIGLEAEYRSIALDGAEGTRFKNLLVGPRYAFTRHHVSPYLKVLLGRGEFTFPYSYAKGSYFVVAPGGGVDFQLGSSRASVRLFDFEYQNWSDFTYGSAHPFGISAGLKFRVF